MLRRLGISAAVLAMGAAMFACTPPAAPAKPKPVFGIGGGACVAGNIGYATVQTTPINGSGHPVETGTVTMTIDGNSVDSEPLVPDPVTGTTNVATFTHFSCPAAGQHTWGFTYSGDSVWATASVTGFDLLSIPAAPAFGADVSGGVVNVGGLGCAQDGTANIFAGAVGDPNPPQVATAEADVTSSFYWYTKVQLPSGTYSFSASCLDGLGNPISYTPVTLTIP